MWFQGRIDMKVHANNGQQKLRTYEDSPKFLSKMKWPRQAMIKYDGRWTRIVKHPDQTVQYFTSGGKMFELLDDQVFGLEETPVGVYFAEMMGAKVEGKLGARIHSGIQTTFFTNTRKGLFNRGRPTWRIFDYVTIADYDVGVCELPFIERWSYLKDKIPTTHLAFDIECENKQHYDMFHAKVVADDWEGTTCIDFNQQWKATTSRPHVQIKRKDLNTADLLVVEELEGEGKYVGMIGSLRCVDGTGRDVCVVGSGLTDEQRASWGSFEGKIVEVRYEQVIDTRLIQPTFKFIRDDKTKAELLK